MTSKSWWATHQWLIVVPLSSAEPHRSPYPSSASISDHLRWISDFWETINLKLERKTSFWQKRKGFWHLRPPSFDFSSNFRSEMVYGVSFWGEKFFDFFQLSIGDRTRFQNRGVNPINPNMVWSLAHSCNRIIRSPYTLAHTVRC